MSPSSLIFVVVVAVWAAYLVVDTSRRREYLATARSVDRFSASMRVLQRRAVRRESAEAFEASTAPMRSTSSVLLHRRPQIVSRAAVEARAARAAAQPVTAAPRGGATGLAARQQVASRLRRARVLAAVTLLLAVATLVCAVLSGIGLITWVVPVVGVVLTTLLLVGLRRAALSARRARRDTARPVARTGAHRVERDDVAASPRAGAADLDADLRPAVAATPIAQEYVPFDYAREVEPSVMAEQAYAQRVAARAEEHDLLSAEDGWAPIPVPPPTYTLKARAEHPLPPPLEIEEIPMPLEDQWDDVPELTYVRASGE